MNNIVIVNQILKDAKEKLKQGWCQGALAKTVDGSPVSSYSPRACQWCLEGAIDVASGTRFSLSRLTRNVLEKILANRPLNPHLTLHTFNDNTTFGQVLALVDHGIKVTEE